MELWSVSRRKMVSQAALLLTTQAMFWLGCAVPARFVWCVLWCGTRREGLTPVCTHGQVVHVRASTGATISTVTVPTPLISSLCFAGPALSTLFVGASATLAGVEEVLSSPSQLGALCDSVLHPLQAITIVPRGVVLRVEFPGASFRGSMSGLGGVLYETPVEA